MGRDRSFPLLLACFFLSGLAALVYETAWTRQFAFVFGTSELAVATVLAAYMAGLALGAAVAGRLAARIARPVLVYGLLELGIAVAALAVPLGLAASRRLYVALFGGLGALPEAGGLATALFYLVCSFVILLVPTAMMGATLPLLARHAVREERQIGGRIGILYATNTAGAVAGVLLAAFVLLPRLGLTSTILAAAAINALVFGAAWALARSASAPPQEPVSAGAAAAELGRGRWILPLIGLSGFASFSYEVLWVRLLGHVVGGSVHAFATMLASFLAGIALGSAVASRFATSPRRAAGGFALAQLGIAALSLAAFFAVNRIPDLSEILIDRNVPRVWVDSLLSMLTLFPAALCIGATFPFAVRVLARRSEDAGPASARVYTANTVGSIVGSIAAGFLLVPELGFAGTLSACVATNLLLAAAAAWLFEPRRPLVLAAAGVGALALALAAPETPWRMLRASSMNGGLRAWGPVQYFGVGRSATVLLTDQQLSYGLKTNGLPEAGMLRPGTYPNRYPLTRWLTALPSLARPDAKNLLLVGFGGGMALEVVPPYIERIDVVELEPEVIEANRSVAELRWRDPLSDPRIHVHLNDARNALLLAQDTRFDIIVSQPSHPWVGGAAHLYTREFFELASSRLSADGVFLQWIGLPFVDEALFRSLLATLVDVFPHVRAYEPPPAGSVLFLASNAPLDLERQVPRALAAAPEAFAELGIRFPADVHASLLLDEQGARELAEGAPLNVDGHNRLQNRSARLGEAAIGRRIDELCGDYDPLVRTPLGDAERFSVLRRLTPTRARRLAESFADPVDRKVGEALAGMAEGARATPQRLLGEALAEEPEHAEARAALLRLSTSALVRGTPPEELLAPPLREAEHAVARGWVARAMDPSGAALLALDAELAAVPLDAPLGPDAARLRIQARLPSKQPELVAEAVAIADASLSDRPDPRSLLLRAEAHAAAGQHSAVLETLGILSERLDPALRVTRAHLRRARELARATPADDADLYWMRRRALQRLGIGPDPETASR